MAPSLGGATTGKSSEKARRVQTVLSNSSPSKTVAAVTTLDPRRPISLASANRVPASSSTTRSVASDPSIRVSSLQFESGPVHAADVLSRFPAIVFLDCALQGLRPGGQSDREEASQMKTLRSRPHKRLFPWTRQRIRVESTSVIISFQ